MKNLSAFTLLFLLIISFDLFAQEKELTVKQITNQLQRRFEMIDDAIIQYEQYNKYGFSSMEQTFSGTLYIKKPNRYRVESEHQTIATNGATVWAFSAVNNQVIIDRYKENDNSLSPEKFMLNLPANYYASIIGTEKISTGRLFNLKLAPKDDRSFVKAIRISIEENNWILKKVVITDINETITAYTVKDIKLNTNINDKTFVFDIPEGAEIVDLR